MTQHTDLRRLCVHEAVENKFPKDAFVEAFDDLSIPAELAGDDETYDTTDAGAAFTPRPEFLDTAWVHVIRAGYNQFDTDAYEAADVPLTNSEGIHGTIVGELALGYMLSLARLLHIYRDHQNDSDWHTPAYEHPLHNRERASLRCWSRNARRGYRSLSRRARNGRGGGPPLR